MKSVERADWLDLGRDLPTTAEDIAVLRRLRRHEAMDLDSYFRFLMNFPPATVEELAARKGPRGPELFALPPHENPSVG
jgi:hypothetical protein